MNLLTEQLACGPGFWLFAVVIEKFGWKSFWLFILNKKNKEKSNGQRSIKC